MYIIRKPAILWAALGLTAATALPAQSILFTIDNQSDYPWHLGHQSGLERFKIEACAGAGKWTARPEALKPGPSLGVIAPRVSLVFKVDLPEGHPGLELYLFRREGPGSLLTLPVTPTAAAESLGTFTLTLDGRLVPPPEAPPRTPTTPGPAAPSRVFITPEPKLLPPSPSDSSPLEHSDGIVFQDGSPLLPPVPGLPLEFQPVLSGRPFMVVTNLSSATWYFQPADENGKMHLMQPEGSLRALKRVTQTVRMPDGHLNEVELPRWSSVKVPPRRKSIIVLEPSAKGVFWVHADSGIIRAFAAVQSQGTIIMPHSGLGLDRHSIDAVFERHLVDWRVFTIQKDTWPEARVPAAAAPVLPTSIPEGSAPVLLKGAIPPDTPLPATPLPMPGAAPTASGECMSWGDVANLMKSLRPAAAVAPDGQAPDL